MTGRPPGFAAVTPRMVVTDVPAAAAFLRATFDAAGEVPDGRPAELDVDGSRIMISAAGAREPFPAFLYVYVQDVDATHARAVAAGASTVEPPGDTPYGERRAMVRDPFGNVYQLARRG